MLKWKGIGAYFDCDDLQVSWLCHAPLNVSYNIVFQQTISQEELEEAITHSCCLLLVLNDETLSSKWCRFEVRH